MNQILSVEMPQKGKRKKSSIKSVVIVFSMFLIIFGIGLISNGAYSYYRQLSNKLDDKIEVASNTKPVITTERESSSKINVVVSHDKEIESLTYKINEEEVVKIDVENKTNIKEEVELPVGTSNITITAKDVNGVTASYQNTFEVEQKPEITFKVVEEDQISIKVVSKIDIDNITYYWDEKKENDEPVKVDDKEFETRMEILNGEHKLCVTAIDKEGNESTKTQKIKGIKGAKEPEIDVKTDGKQFIINAKDEDELEKIEITLNNNDKITEEVKEKEYQKNIQLEDGENKLTVTAYNKQGLTSVKRVKCNKE